jgi:hypothetical protein
MAKTDPDTLVELLRRGTPRTRVGLWRMPLNKIGKEAEIAIQLGVQALDISRYYYDHLPNTIASSIGSSNCVLIYNLDLLLAALKVEEQQQIWKDLFNRFPNRLRSLIIIIPETAYYLLPSETLLEKWQQESRLV